jgi:hypothetical protein
MARRRTPAEHYEQAQNTQGLYQHLGGQNSNWPGWSATLLFYVAVQEVEAALRSLNEQPSTDHNNRDSKIRRRFLGNLPAAYQSLKQLAHNARYHGFEPTSNGLALAEANLAIVRQDIQQIASPPY